MAIASTTEIMTAFTRLFGTALLWLLSLSLLAAPTSSQRYVLERYPHAINSNTLTIRLQALGEAPEWMAVVVTPNDSIADWGGHNSKRP